MLGLRDLQAAFAALGALVAGLLQQAARQVVALVAVQLGAAQVAASGVVHPHAAGVVDVVADMQLLAVVFFQGAGKVAVAQ